ncbi:AsmA family protein [Rickettsiales bacterium]|nr:AsmA family protein [Rickettsiales bacterium]
MAKSRKLIIAITSIITFMVISYFIFLSLPIHKILKEKAVSYISQYTGTKVTIAELTFMPFIGQLNVEGLVIHNPEGYKSPSLFKLDKLFIHIDNGSIFSDKIKIYKVELAKPHLNLEMLNGVSNVDVIVQNSKNKAAKPKDDKSKSSPEKKFVIDQLSIESGVIDLAEKVVPLGAKHTINVPDIYLEKVGTDNSPISAKGLSALIVKTLEQKLEGIGAKLFVLSLGNVTKNILGLPLNITKGVLGLPLKAVEGLLGTDKK